MASAFVCHKVSANHQFANGTYFTTSALVLKFSAFFENLFTFFSCLFTIFQKMSASQTHFGLPTWGKKCLVSELLPEERDNFDLGHPEDDFAAFIKIK